MAPDNTLSVAPLPNFELASDIAFLKPRVDAISSAIRIAITPSKSLIISPSSSVITPLPVKSV